MNLPRALPRLAAAALFVALLALLFASEQQAASDRAEPTDSAEMAADLPDATQALRAAVVDLQTSCSDLAAEALDATATLTDRAELFDRLAAIALPQHAGIRVEDRDGNVLAWTGDPLDAKTLRDMPRAIDGSMLVESAGVRRLAVRRRRTTPLEGVPVLAVVHRPFEIRSPLTNRFQSSWSLADDVTAPFLVGAARIYATPQAPESGSSPAGASNGGSAPIQTAAVPDQFGPSVLSVSVRAMDDEVWRAAADARAARRRAILMAAVLLTVAILTAWRETSLLPASRGRAAWLLRAAVILSVRAALGTASLATIWSAPVRGGTRPAAVLDVLHYNHSLPLAVAATPLDLLATTVAILAAAYCLRTALLAPWADDGDASPRAATPRRIGVALAATLVAALLCSAALSWLIDDVVRNSTVSFFRDDAVLPHPASAALLASLFAAGAAAVFVVTGIWRALCPAGTVHGGVAAACCAAAAFALQPMVLAGTASSSVALAIVGSLGFAAAILPATLGASVALRAALAPLGIAIGLFAPLALRVDQSVRANVVEYAKDRIESSDGTERQFVNETLRRLRTSSELLELIRARKVTRDTLLRLWSASPLAARTGGSSIVVSPLAQGFDPSDAPERVSFSVNLPPAGLLPRPVGVLDGAGERALPGKGPMVDGRWIVGDTTITDGEHVVAQVRVMLEVRAPSFLAVPELPVLGPRTSDDQLRTPPLAVTQYAPDGTLVELETNDPYRPAGATLSATIREECVGTGHAAWRAVRAGDRDLAVAVLADVPPTNGGPPIVRGFQAFSYDTGGARAVALRAARAMLYGALISVILLALTFRRWASGARLRLAHRLVASFVIVSGLPLLVLGWANREFAQQRAAETTTAELRQSVALVESVLRQPKDNLLTVLRDFPDPIREERLREVAYNVGHHFSVFFDADLRSSSDLGLFDTELLPRRLPGNVYREVWLRRRPFLATQATVGETTFDIGYAPLRDEQGDLLGIVSLPLLQQRRQRDRELADGVTAILALYLASLAAAVAVGTWIASRVTAPLRDLSAATQRVARGDLTQVVPKGGTDELGEVVGGFNRMMRDLAESRERLVRAEKEAAWRDMARQVAHEVKNPLTPMRLAAEHIRRAWRDKHPEFNDLLERGVDVIVRQTESLKQIATAFSDFARLSGRRRESVDLETAVGKAIDLYRAQEGLTVQLDLAAGLPPVMVDPDELSRVLVNLVKNAVEAMEPSATHPGTLTVKLAREDRHLLLRIIDDGPGIPADVLPRLFEPYFSTKTSGTGLGLAICKRAIEDFGGSIGIESTPAGVAPRGTTVTVRLPVGAANETAPTKVGTPN